MRMEVAAMAGNFRIEAYSALYSSFVGKSGIKGDRYANSFNSGVFVSGNTSGNGLSVAGSTSKSEIYQGISEGIKEDSKRREQEELKRIHDQLRQMKKDELRKQQIKQEKLTNPNADFPISPSSIDDFLKLSGAPENEEEKEEELEVTRYNYKDVANKIVRAKTSQSAGQAVLSAKRKVVEVKRMISKGDGDPEELQLALTHAKRMEMAARKKKHHLELEEYAENTHKLDEKLNKEEDQAQNIRSMETLAAEDELSKQEDAIFEVRQDMIEEVMDSIRESSMEVSDEELASINEMISNFGEEQLEMLEETMQMLEEMELINPHMSEEELEKVKQRHRASENKAIVKANMDYLKGMFKHLEDKKGITPSMNTGSSHISMPAFTAAAASTTAPPPTVFADAGAQAGSVDISL